MEDVYRFYVENVSTPGYAISLQLSRYLICLMDNLKPNRILDLGSGFSSYILRLKGAEVWSIDTDKKWLEKTKRFLKRFNMFNGHFLLLNDLDFSARQYDLVFLDTTPHIDRYKLFNSIKQCCTGVVIFDDTHPKPAYKGYTEKIEKSFKTWKIKNLSRETMDEFGRYAYAAFRGVN